MLRAVSASAAESQQVWTIGKVLGWTQRRFAERGLASPRLDAELLLSAALGRPRVGLYTGYDQPLLPEELTRLRELIRRRLQGESVAYLTEQKDFWTLTLRVSAAVLVPRPETELLVEVALRLLRPAAEVEAGAETVAGDPAAADAPPAPQSAYQRGAGDLTIHYEEEAPESAAPAPAAAAPVPADEPAAPRVVADIGTGSGAVALVLKKERPELRVLAVDCSAEALLVARDNGARLGLAVEFLHGDLLAPLVEHAPLDLIVSNPPYIPSGDIAQLAPEVRCEPHLALDGGPDGLSVIRRLVADARGLLKPGGALALELGAGQAAAALVMLRQAGYRDVGSELDLAGIERVVYGRRPVRD